jgi:hypothetical protein
MYDYKSHIENYPEILTITKKTMKTLNFEKTKSIFDEFALSNEEMINVRGGDLDPLPTPTKPPIKI